MMTKQTLDAEAIEAAAYEADSDRVFCDGFRHGARWAAERLGAEVVQVQAQAPVQDCSNCKHGDGGDRLTVLFCDRCTKWEEGPGLEGYEPKESA